MTELFRTYDQVSEQYCNGDLAHRWHINRSLFLDGWTIEILEGREVYADCTISNEFCWNLVALSRNTTNDDIADGDTLLQAPTFLVLDLMPWCLYSLTTGEKLNAGQIDRVNRSSIVGEESRERPTVDFRSVNDGDSLAKKSIAVRQNGIVDLKMLQNLDYSQRSARQDGLFHILRRIQKSDVVVHVIDMLVAETLHILCQGHGLLDVPVMCRVAREDWVVDEDAVDLVIFIGSHDLFFELVLVDLTKLKVESTNTCEFPRTQSRQFLHRDGENCLGRKCLTFPHKSFSTIQHT
jgi:hypothetical protein